LQDMVRLALRHKQPELLEHGVILLQDNAIPSVSWCAKSGTTSELGCIGTCSLLPRFQCMLLLVGCICETTSSG
jgi:hypothetical protein